MNIKAQAYLNKVDTFYMYYTKGRREKKNNHNG